MITLHTAGPVTLRKNRLEQRCKTCDRLLCKGGFGFPWYPVKSCLQEIGCEYRLVAHGETEDNRYCSKREILI